MKNLSSLPLQQQFNQLMQDVKKLKKENFSHPDTRSKLQSVTNEKEIKQILFKTESQSNILKIPSTATYDFGKITAVTHKKKVMQEISNIKRIKDPIANYQEFLRDAHILSQIEDCMNSRRSVRASPAEAYDFDFHTSGERYLEKIASQRERNSATSNFMDNVKTISKFQAGTIDKKLLASASTRNLRNKTLEKENKYTVELRKLVLERKSLRSVQRL